MEDMTEYKWFIEKAETGEWFRNTLGIQPTKHTFGVGWDKPPLWPEDYWTKNPMEALSYFKNREDCEEFITTELGRKPMRLEYMKDGQYDVPRVLVATEHEFVDGDIKNKILSKYKHKTMIEINDPNGILDIKPMKLYAEKGHKVTVTKNSIDNGYQHDKDVANKYLIVGNVYTVESMNVENWSSKVLLQEIPGITFNSVNFVDFETTETGIELIQKERDEQIENGYTTESDIVNNDNYALALATVGLLLQNLNQFPTHWEPEDCIKLINKPYKERLIIAGAFIAAEIDRITAIENVKQKIKHDTKD